MSSFGGRRNAPMAAQILKHLRFGIRSLASESASAPRLEQNIPHLCSCKYYDGKEFSKFSKTGQQGGECVCQLPLKLSTWKIFFFILLPFVFHG